LELGIWDFSPSSLVLLTEEDEVWSLEFGIFPSDPAGEARREAIESGRTIEGSQMDVKQGESVVGAVRFV